MSLLDFEQQLSPYYHKGHSEYRKHCRKFVEEHIAPYSESWIQKKSSFDIRSYSKKLAEYGGLWYFPFGHKNVTWNGYEWDPFYQIIFYQEFAKPVFLAKSHIHRICIEPIEHFGTSAIHRKALDEIQTGEKLVCLAISELSGGSDVKSIKTTAKLSKDGQNYIVNGNKYWITAGLRADYFVTAVRTGTIEDGRNGVSLLLIPRCKGVYTSKLPLQGLNMSDTSTVTFANVNVPKENIIGELNKGWKPLMTNFNLERFCICCDVISYCIVCVNESIKWSRKRSTFGKKLIHHQVIRHKIANMARKVIAVQSLLERVAYQLKNDRYMEKDKSIARNIALLKVTATNTLQYCTIESSQIFGGRSYVQGGVAAKIERLYRYVRATSIYGGSLEIMLNLAMKQAKL